MSGLVDLLQLFSFEFVVVVVRALAIRNRVSDEAETEVLFN